MKTAIRLTALIAIHTAAAAFGQGALTPPGAPAPMMKTLDQIEPRIVIQTLPFIISAPGSYVLGRNMAGAEGITIAASDVTLDLNGFVLTGSAGNTGSGVLVAGVFERVIIRNGIVRDWGAHGIAALTTAGAVIEKVQVAVNTAATPAFTAGIATAAAAQVSDCTVAVTGGHAGTTGISTGDRSMVRNCTVSGIAGVGISGTAGNTVTGCTVSGCDGVGIAVQFGANVGGCVASSNGGAGITAGDAAAIRDSVAAANGANGFTVGAGVVMSNCTAGSNGQSGFALQSGATLTGCVAMQNSGHGFSGLSSNVLTGCAVRGTGETGIHLDGRNRVTNCTVDGSQASGINVGFENAVTECVVTGSLAHGIVATTSNELRGNRIASTGVLGDGFPSASIYVNGTFNVVDGNTCTSFFGGDIGIHVPEGAIRNFITRNRVAAATEYVIAPSNHVAPIVNAALTGANINGSTGGTAFGSTDPLANWSY